MTSGTTVEDGGERDDHRHRHGGQRIGRSTHAPRPIICGTGTASARRASSTSTRRRTRPRAHQDPGQHQRSGHQRDRLGQPGEQAQAEVEEPEPAQLHRHGATGRPPPARPRPVPRRAGRATCSAGRPWIDTKSAPTQSSTSDRHPGQHGTGRQASRGSQETNPADSTTTAATPRPAAVRRRPVRIATTTASQAAVRSSDVEHQEPVRRRTPASRPRCRPITCSAEEEPAAGHRQQRDRGQQPDHRAGIPPGLRAQSAAAVADPGQEAGPQQVQRLGRGPGTAAGLGRRPSAPRASPARTPARWSRRIDAQQAAIVLFQVVMRSLPPGRCAGRAAAARRWWPGRAGGAVSAASRCSPAPVSR